MGLLDLFKRKPKNNNTNAPIERVGGIFGLMDVELNTRHDLNADFGYPKNLTFEHYFEEYKRGDLGYGAIQKLSKKTFEEYPSFQENEEDIPTPQEELVAQHLKDIRFWQEVNEADRRGMVGGFGALALRLGDGRDFDMPVARVKGGIRGLVEVKPIWADQLEVVKFYDDPSNKKMYGQAAMYQFIEGSRHNNTGKARHERHTLIHPDRLIIFSRDGTIFSESLLRSGYNALYDLRKLNGAGAAGFWRNSKQAPFLVADKEISNERAMQDVGANNAEEYQKFLSEKVSGFLKGHNNYMFLKGVNPTFPDVRLADPRYFYHNLVSSFAASVDIPVKILTGNQTGERASSEDSKEWNLTCEARRSDVITPPLNELLRRFKKWGMINEADWYVHWLPLSNATEQEKIDRADKMAAINFQMLQYSNDIVFTPDEIRKVLNYPPLTEEDKNSVEIFRETAIGNNDGTENTDSIT